MSLASNMTRWDEVNFDLKIKFNLVRSSAVWLSTSEHVACLQDDMLGGGLTCKHTFEPPSIQARISGIHWCVGPAFRVTILEWLHRKLSTKEVGEGARQGLRGRKLGVHRTANGAGGSIMFA